MPPLIAGTNKEPFSRVLALRWRTVMCDRTSGQHWFTEKRRLMFVYIYLLNAY